MTLEAILLFLNVTVDIDIVLLVDVLPQQVQAVQLMEDLDCSTVTLLAGLWVGHLERVPGQS